jgi:uncharacterized protein YjgD (DUF1641 family)
MNTNNETELLNLYRDNNALRDDLKEADISNIEKIAAIKDAIDELHQIIAKLRPSGEVADAIDEVIADLEEAIR